jgi:hypothetical protein
MIDVYAIEGTLKDPRALATDLAQTMMVVLQAPEIREEHCGLRA